MKLQSEMIKENKLLYSKVDSNVVQKLHLEKRKMILLPIVDMPVTSNREPSSPDNSVTKSLCIIRKACKNLHQFVCEVLHKFICEVLLIVYVGNYVKACSIYNVCQHTV